MRGGVKGRNRRNEWRNQGEERQRAVDEANRKRGEFASSRERTIEGTFTASGSSNEEPLVETPKSRENYTDTRKAQAAGVSHATAERAHAVVTHRPDLAEHVRK